MYPYELFWGIDLYQILMALGFMAALIFFRIFADRKKLPAKLQNLVIYSALVALLGGYAASVFVQAIYNALETGVFTIAADTGSTFYGGLIGGAGAFLLIYFPIGNRICKNGENRKNAWTVTEIAAGSIPLAHGLGRLGCLCAGCCYGKPTDAWYGIYNVYLHCKTVPVQLFEALFLFLIVALVAYRLVKNQKGNMSLYLAIYGVWRFFAEYLRDDDRGNSPIPFLSPSQLTAILLLVFAAVLWLVEKKHLRLEKEKEDGEHGA